MPTLPIPMGIPGRWLSIQSCHLTTLEIWCSNKWSEGKITSLHDYCSSVAFGVGVLLGVDVSVGVGVIVGVEVGGEVGPGVGV